VLVLQIHTAVNTRASCPLEAFVSQGSAATSMKRMQVEKSTFHLIDHESFPAEGGFKIEKTRPWQDVIDRTYDISGIPGQNQTWWIFCKNSDRTFRPTCGLLPQVRSATLSATPVLCGHVWRTADKFFAVGLCA
jgi:hypothetical protein